MSAQNIIIYKFKTLYYILEELRLNLKFNFICLENETSLKNEVKNLNSHLIISNKKKNGLV